MVRHNRTGLDRTIYIILNTGPDWTEKFFVTGLDRTNFFQLG